MLRMVCYAAFLWSVCADAAQSAEKKLNVVLVLADDLGWADLSCYGSKFHASPAIDALASQGMRFTQAYAAGSVCSPTRGSVMTGKYPVRTGVTDFIPGLESGGRRLNTQPTRRELALDEVTIAEALQARGYQTFYSGKWHLGGPGFGPEQQGFETVVEDASLGDEGRDPLVGDRLTDSALKFLDDRDRSRPFFMFLGYHEPHTPLNPHPRHIESFQAAAAKLAKVEPATRPERNGITKLVQDDPVYAGEIAVFDEGVQRIDAKLTALGLTDDTVFIFTSDNGGLSTRSKPGTTSNLPLRAGKGWLYEGGIRVPLVIRAPGIVKPGQSCDVPVMSTDFFPTLLELAGAPLEPKHHQDGRSFLPLLRGETSAARPMYWHYPHYHGSMWAPGSAIRDGDWKLIEFFDPPSVELYDLGADPGEQQNLALAQPEKTAELQTKLTAWRKVTDAFIPTLNESVSDRVRGAGESPVARGAKNDGETLYNGIRLPRAWPPIIDPAEVRAPVPPPYLRDRPAVVPIDVGRQLFVDDFLIEQTTLKREFHQPEKHPANPVLRAERNWEQGVNQSVAAPFSDGAFYNPQAKEFRLWYMSGWFDGTALATSRDGVRWERPPLGVVRDTNLVLNANAQWRRDGVSIWLDHDTAKPDERYKMFLYARTGAMGAAALPNEPGGMLFSSPDGVHWSLRGRTGFTHDNTSFFYNPFRKVWGFSHRTHHELEGKRSRTRGYTEHRDFFAAVGDSWDKDKPVFWARSDEADAPLPEIGDIPQLYKIDAVAYESVMLGLFETLYGPENKVCSQVGIPKQTDLHIAFSRDGFHWDRSHRRPFIAASRKVGDWERGYLKSTGGCCLVVGDRLHFYYGAFQGDETNRGNGGWSGMYSKAATGLATLRRDGFASMNADAVAGSLTTRPVRFQGKHLFVNVDCPQGELRAEVLDEAGQVIDQFQQGRCEPVRGDSTRHMIHWNSGADLSALRGRPVRFRFHLTGGKLYAFWVSPAANGASNGYVAAGGPGFTGAIDAGFPARQSE